MELDATGNDEQWFAPPVAALPVLYFIVVVRTAIISRGMPGGAFHRIIGVNPVLGAFMMAYDNSAVIVGAFFVSGLP
jgi:hypothetical protein